MDDFYHANCKVLKFLVHISNSENFKTENGVQYYSLY